MTVIDAALHASLRTLKLSGMLETLDARLTQAHAGQLGHLDFLQVLCQDEITRRETMSMHRRLRRAHFDEQTTLEGFDFAASPKLPTAQIRDLAALRWLHSGESVLLHGPVGVGKTHVAQALGHLAIRQGAEVRFNKTSRVLAHLAGGHADRTWPKRLAELTRPHLLILDNFAMREHTPQQADDLYELISERAQADRSLITTSQPQPTRLVSAVSQPGRRRVPARPAHQHQPPGLHERPQLPAKQTPWARRPPGHQEPEVAK
ncbi:ATP-binding protein [Rhizomonospora bruguierae]|uniref:ATP-binding protein n=1 Tax=Rhizomonospora bruguierae TaxID=1581705 RepID=UPI0024BD8B52|nr:ATP-binding protein [Micromonospora sp. NBRC 107566]